MKKNDDFYMSERMFISLFSRLTYEFKLEIIYQMKFFLEGDEALHRGSYADEKYNTKFIQFSKGDK